MKWNNVGKKSRHPAPGRQLARGALASVLAVSLLLAGCTAKPADEQTRKVVRIPFGSEESFYSTYGDYFAFKFPDVEVEIISTEDLHKTGNNYFDEFEKLVREQKPDLVITHPSFYFRWANKGMLLDLEPFVRNSGFDLSQFVPAAIARLKENDEGKLFGLAPELTSSGLYYNKDLFDKYGVPYPKNQMSWEETMELSRRFPVDPDPEKRIYGIHLKYWTTFDFIQTLAATENASYISPDMKRLTFESDIWKKSFKHIIEGFRSKNLYYYYKDGKPVRYGPDETKEMDLFSRGKAAMTVSGVEQLFRMKQWGTQDFNWDVVTVPVDPANPEYTNNFDVDTIFVIPANADNPDTAWSIVQYFNSEEAAKVKMKMDDVFSSRTAFATTKDGQSLEPFYMLKRKKEELDLTITVPDTFYPVFSTPFQLLYIREIDEAVNGRKTIEEAIYTIQTEGQKLLDQAWAGGTPPPAK
ncbi:ABC transporter substrate-binding protein [Paenibacillus oceani]|uniref:Extracellular solute-binding protein n=1 Tax=Paenibacillus oceani TaxID=2772510 RepID=A0A927GZU4_9BACL|nr:extracellular solute-binding protein [Paenibacillus oceani]MBD2863356.1 extracellular solute-binding protein [Paenibacillus oceani]